MTLAEKLRALREEEGRARGLGRAMTKADVSRAMQAELGRNVSPAYLSQLESGARLHLTSTTRALLADFFKVHPGYLVDDAPAPSGDGASPDKLVGWLQAQAQHFQEDYLVAKVMSELSARAHPRKYFEALDRLLELPAHELERLIESGFGVESESV